MSRADGGPAFPHKAFRTPNDCITPDLTFPSSGMTIRDWFAGRAMQAYIFPEMLHGANTEQEIANEYQNIAAFAYRMADAMLAERAKP